MAALRVVVVGGGLAGLTAAWHAVRQGVAVTVIESGARLGGQVQTERVRGCVLEHGAEGFVARSDVVPALCEALGLNDGLLSQSTRRALALEGGVLQEMSEGTAGWHLGIQATKADWGHGLRTLKGGMGSLVDGIEGALGPAAIARDMTVRQLVPNGASGWCLEMADGTAVDADAVILAIPGAAVARVLAVALPTVASWFQGLQTVSSVSVTLVMQRDDVRHPLDASGFVNTTGPGPGFRACTFTSSKFADRAPESSCILRAFYRPEAGRVGETDEYWSTRCVADLAPVLGMIGEPVLSRVMRWPSAISRYAGDHDKQFNEIMRDIRLSAGLEFAGAAVARSGVDGAVRSGIDSAARILARTLA
jgi:oxygen-dependent protoporphyrinogen oxidase